VSAPLRNAGYSCRDTCDRDAKATEAGWILMGHRHITETSTINSPRSIMLATPAETPVIEMQRRLKRDGYLWVTGILPRQVPSIVLEVLCWLPLRRHLW